MQDYHYQLLDVPFSANRKEIAVAYRKQMRFWHPDHVRQEDKSAAEEYSKRLNLAYSVLSNPHKRQEYDRSIRVEAMQAQIMERYVAGYGGWNLGDGPHQPAEAPRREKSAHELREQVATDRQAVRGILVFFGMLAAAGIALLIMFSLIQTLLNALT